MAASKHRPLWREVPSTVRRAIERIAGGTVVTSQNCAGGFSAGLASRLTLADGTRVFAKAINAGTAASEIEMYRREAWIAAALPTDVPVPRLLGTFDDGEWTALVFEDVDGHEPVQPWDQAQLRRVLSTIDTFAHQTTPAPIALATDHPRLGGWHELARDTRRPALAEAAPWAAENLTTLIDLEDHGRQVARGNALVHFDLYAHNILLTPSQVYFVDWPHARLGAPFVDLVMLLSTLTPDGPTDPERIVSEHPLTATIDPRSIDALLAAHAGFCVAGGLTTSAPEFAPIRDAKLALARTALTWLARRLDTRAASTHPTVDPSS